MADVHLYFGIENIGLNATQRATLVDVLRSLGPASDPQPCMLNHRRVRLDGEAAIFEARFDEDTLTINAMKQRLGTIFGVSWATIGSSTANHDWGGQTTPVVTFSRAGTDYLRMALFGGTDATWEESRQATLGYLAAYQEQWETSD